MTATKNQIKAFIARVAPIAQAQAKKHGNQLFPSVTIAQAAHESGWGTSAKMVNANALYGVKVGKAAYKFGTAWDGAAYKSGTTEYYDGKNPTGITDYFRAYSSIEAATEDYMDLLCHASRYKAALNRRTPQESIAGIVAGNYATGPDYVQHIMATIRAHNLTIYDDPNHVAPPAPDYIVGRTYTLTTNLYVRKSPNGEKVRYIDLTSDAKKHGEADEKGMAILWKGTRVTCKGMSGAWMKIPSGYVCTASGGKKYIE